MVDLNISSTVIVDLFLDSFAIISMFITLYVLRKIINVTSEFSLKAPIVNKEILDYIRKSNEENHITIKKVLDVFQKHIDKIDDLAIKQEKIILNQEKIISKQEIMISKQEIMIDRQQDIFNTCSQQQLPESIKNQENQDKNIYNEKTDQI